MRPVLLGLGLATLAGAWLLPLGQILPGPFSAHMTMHMAVVAVAAPLLAVGAAGSKLDPAVHVPSLFSPIPASVVELLAVWSWHAPVLHHFARNTALGSVLEQGTFIASGLVVWLSVFGGNEAERLERRGAGVLALLLTSMHMTLLGALLALPPRALYSHAAHAAHAAVGPHAAHLSPLEDQHLGGAIMLLVGGVVYLAGALWLMRGFVSRLGAPRSTAAPSELRSRP